MSVLKGKKILLAVTAGIAAYKTTYLVRMLVKKGAIVKVIMTPEAIEFVTPLTLATLSKNPVEWEFTKDKGEWNNHVAYGLWADLMLIAPLTARTLSSMADGQCSNLVLATYLSAKCPVVVAPAMDLDMYAHPTTRENLSKIQANGNKVIPATSGELASGLSGQGRMEEPEQIVEYLEDYYHSTLPLYQKNILISAGPTYEAIDPVRFIGNHSSGKMGFEIAKEASKLGANVTLVSGPSAESVQGYNVKRINVQSALEMLQAMENHFEASDILIMAAAVADYRPKNVANQKIKKNAEQLTIELVKNPDILQTLGAKKGNTFVVGFALETQHAIENAEAKLKRKNADMIVLNSLEDKDAGFGLNTNKVSFITQDKPPKSFEVKSKTDVAKDILQFIKENIKA